MNFPLDSVTEMSDDHKAMLSAQLEAMQVIIDEPRLYSFHGDRSCLHAFYVFQ